jgi:hypothetical protein
MSMVKGGMNNPSFFIAKYFYMKISEIITVDQLVQSTAAVKQKVYDLCDNHYKDNLWYYNDGSQLIVCAKNDENNLGYIVGQKYQNKKFESIPNFVVAKNFYSWANDNGQTALGLILALINISTIPVLSDIEMTEYAKKFFKKNIANGTIKAKTFNLNNGDITAYNPDIWDNDDDFRVIFLENKFGNPILNEHSVEIFQGRWNWQQIQK